MVVEVHDGSVQEVARLDGIGDWGVVLAHPFLGGVFRPWNQIDAMWLAREEDLTDPPGNDDLTG